MFYIIFYILYNIIKSNNNSNNGYICMSIVIQTILIHRIVYSKQYIVSSKLVFHSDHGFLSSIDLIPWVLGFSALLLSCRDSQTPGPMWEQRQLWSRPKRLCFPPLNYGSSTNIKSNYKSNAEYIVTGSRNEAEKKKKGWKCKVIMWEMQESSC